MAINIDDVILDAGAHQDPEHGNCLLEVVSIFAGEEFSAEPECVSPTLRRVAAALNDSLDNAQRQELVRFIPRLPGTAGDGKDEARGFLALDWLVHVYAPAWLRLVPALVKDADLLAQSPPITDLESAAAVSGAVHAAAKRAQDVDRGAGDATDAVAWSMDRAIAGVVAGASAWAVALAVEPDDRAALAPMIEMLHESAIDLFDRMITGARPVT